MIDSVARAIRAFFADTFHALKHPRTLLSAFAEVVLDPRVLLVTLSVLAWTAWAFLVAGLAVGAFR